MSFRITPYLGYGISMICDLCKTMTGLWLRCVICDYVQFHGFTMAIVPEFDYESK
ncbi:hypothetical protein F383_03867 [Gossypium arboreum]|uniref:Uncharacterized protein n=1 Tax=Gossypium arboreum TaxID=29729 RepID=A0A0B0NIM7_GOSAR|nr:hypothetical protein F383_03867 [Gossypium arboreum]